MKLIEKPVTDKRYQKIVTRFADLEFGPWVAGGSVRKMWEDKPWIKQDIDFFFASSTQFKTFVDRVSELGKIEYKHETDNAITYKIYTGPIKEKKVFDKLASLVCLSDRTDDPELSPENWITVQFVRRKFYCSFEDVLNDFDINVAQFVTDGNIMLATEQALVDLENKLMRLNPMSTKGIKPLRFAKYCAYGFKPDVDLFVEVVRDMLKNGYSHYEY